MNNVVGTKFSIRGKIQRLKKFFDGEYRDGIRENISVLLHLCLMTCLLPARRNLNYLKKCARRDY